MPLASLIDADPTQLAGVHVVGGKADEVVRALESRARDHIDALYFELPPTEYSYGGALLKVFADDSGTVPGWELGAILYQATEATFGDIIDVTTTTWRKPDAVEEQQVVFRRDPLDTVDRALAPPFG